MTTDELRTSPPRAPVAVARSTHDSRLDGDRGMRLLEWLLVAMCSVTVGLLALAH